MLHLKCFTLTIRLTAHSTVGPELLSSQITIRIKSELFSVTQLRLESGYNSEPLTMVNVNMTATRLLQGLNGAFFHRDHSPM